MAKTKPAKKKSKKINNPNGRALRLEDEQGATELAKLINFAMLGEGRQFKLKELADMLQTDYHALWQSYRARRKCPLPVLVRLCQLVNLSIEDAALIYMRQPVPVKPPKDAE